MAYAFGLVIMAFAAAFTEKADFGMSMVVASAYIIHLAVSLFHTYLSPEAYELIVKELSVKFGCNINKVKTAYDCFSTVLGMVLSFAFFGFGVFEGVKLRTGNMCAYKWLLNRQIHKTARALL